MKICNYEMQRKKERVATSNDSNGGPVFLHHPVNAFRVYHGLQWQYRPLLLKVAPGTQWLNLSWYLECPAHGWA